VFTVVTDTRTEVR